MTKPLPNRQWLQRTRRQMCVSYQGLSDISMVDYQRRCADKGARYSDEQKAELREAIGLLSRSIDKLNDLLELPRGS